ncbi:trimeric intracellular cation channel family protein [Salinibacter grassmerensis]|uniref:trimeric intracellular cation channel family protein n=1 Tax=Salinibacter grassmerensis TaxID=3040353 RepID=UPI0021E759DC|nr:trimeric intracellular cation channel family protein [Salinibacter grassmerensis]
MESLRPIPVSPGTILYVLDLFGTAVFAVSGALAAGQRRMDLFGALVIAAVTAVGGGTIRDLILDRHPVFWIQDLRYLAVIAGAGGLTFAYTSVFRPPRQSLEVADAFGLAVFSVVGARVALGVGAPPVVVVIMSAVTATVGGMVRDVLCDETPLILREEIYATAALSGGVLYLGLRAAALPEAAVAGLTIVTVSAVRLAALRWEVHLPSFRVEEAG